MNEQWEQVEIVRATDEDEIVVLDDAVGFSCELESVQAAQEQLEDETIYSFEQEERRLLVKELLAVKESVRDLEARLGKLEGKS